MAHTSTDIATSLVDQLITSAVEHSEINSSVVCQFQEYEDNKLSIDVCRKYAILIILAVNLLIVTL